MKNFYPLFAAFVLFFTPLSMQASKSYFTRILGNEKYLMLGGESVDSGAIDVTPPLLSNCPKNIVKTPTEPNACWTISWHALAVTDACNPPTITQTAGPTNGSCLASGTYSVIYRATDDKGNRETCAFVITVDNYIEDDRAVYLSNCNSDICLFPNPVKDLLNVDLTKYKGLDVTISLYNLFGQPILTQQFEKVREDVVHLDVSKHQAGNYWLRVVAEDRNDAVKQVHIAK